MGHYGINVFPVHFFLVLSDTVYWSPLSSFLYSTFCYLLQLRAGTFMIIFINSNIAHLCIQKMKYFEGLCYKPYKALSLVCLFILQYFSFIHLVIYLKILIGYLLNTKSLSHFHFAFCAMVYLISGLLFQAPFLSPHCSLFTQIELYTPFRSQLKTFHQHLHVLSRSPSCGFSELPGLFPIITAFLLVCVCYYTVSKMRMGTLSYFQCSFSLEHSE